MAKRKTFVLNKDLQEGLTQTMSAVKNYAGELHFEIVPLTQIEFDPDNPRDLVLDFTDLPQGPLSSDPLYDRKMQEIQGLNSLAETINKQGLINPVMVYKQGSKYRLIAGERRCLASKMAGKNEIKAHILSEKPTELRQRLLQWIENIEREDLSLWERLQNIKMILGAYQKQNPEPKDLNANLIKNILGCSLPHAQNYFSVLKASKELLGSIERQDINSLEKAALIAKIENKTLQNETLQACLAGASLSQLKKSVEVNKKAIKAERKQAVTQSLATGRGRKANRINLGFVKDPIIVKTLIEAVIDQDRFRHYHTRFNNIDWNEFSQVNVAFSNLLEVIRSVDSE